MKKFFSRNKNKPEDTLISRTGRFIACELVEGDYLEFGVYRGNSFIAAFKAFQWHFERRSSEKYAGKEEAAINKERKKLWDKMRFFAFDSFEGLPELTVDDATTADFAQGQYAFDQASFHKRIVRKGVDERRVTEIKGWFNDTCNAATKDKYHIQKAAVIWIDCDLYSSTVDVLNFVTDLLQDGTVIIFDDWFSYKGSPFQGEQRAFNEWKAQPRIKDKFVFNEYQRESWKRMSFIVSELPASQ